MKARELIETYADEPNQYGWRPEDQAPEAFAALRAVLDNCDFIDCLIGQYKPYEIARMIRAAITTALETSS